METKEGGGDSLNQEDKVKEWREKNNAEQSKIRNNPEWAKNFERISNLESDYSAHETSDKPEENAIYVWYSEALKKAIKKVEELDKEINANYRIYDTSNLEAVKVLYANARIGLGKLKQERDYRVLAYLENRDGAKDEKLAGDIKALLGDIDSIIKGEK